MARASLTAQYRGSLTEKALAGVHAQYTGIARWGAACKKKKADVHMGLLRSGVDILAQTHAHFEDHQQMFCYPVNAYSSGKCVRGCSHMC